MDQGLINELAKQGVLGIVTAISFSLNFILLKMLLAEKDKRIEEANHVTENIVVTLNAIKESVSTLVESALRRKR